MLQGSGETQQRSKRLRREMSPPEIALWLALRERPEGLKFRRQHPSGPFTADFYCHAARMIVEVDGTAHDCGDRPARDASRDQWFESRGLAVMRVTARQAIQDLEDVVRGVVAFAADRIAALERDHDLHVAVSHGGVIGMASLSYTHGICHERCDAAVRLGGGDRMNMRQRLKFLNLALEN